MRQPLGDGLGASPPVLRHNAGRNRVAHSNTLQTPLYRRETSGGVTPLATYAAVASTLVSPAGLPPVAPNRPGLLSRTAQAVRTAVGGSEPVAWLQQRMQTLRTEALTGEPPGDRTQDTGVTLALGSAASTHAVSRFWRQPSVATHAPFGVQQSALLEAFDRMGRDHGPHVGLGLSLAFASVAGATHRDPVPEAVHAFHGVAPLARILRAGAPEAAGTAAATTLAVLRRVSDNNQFPAYARALAPGLQDEQMAPLRRMLQAQSALSTTDGTPRPGLTDSARALAERVRDTAMGQLRPNAPAPTRQQTVDAFLWDNQFRDDGPGSPLATLRQHFSRVVQSLAQEPTTGGLLSAAYAFGVSGADRHLLKDEVTRLEGLRDSDELNAVVDALKTKTQQSLLEALRDTNHPQFASRIPIALAQLVALDDWSPAKKGSLSAQDMVKGPSHARDDPALRGRIAQFCDRLELGGDEESGPSSVQLPEPTRLHAAVQGELSHLRLGFEGLFRLADALAVPLDAGAQSLAKQSATVIHGHTCKPGEATPAAVGAMLGGFLAQVQFGNHARFSHLSSGTISARGAGVNATSLEEGSRVATAGPRALGVAVAPALNFALERGREQVLRVGAATHGVEIFLGHNNESVNAEGVSLAGGYPNDRSLLMRAGAGVDTLYKGLRNSRHEGAMLRVDRRIVEDHEDAIGERVFAQNDADVRATASQMVKTLLERAPLAQTDAQRAALLDDLIVAHHDQGLSLSLMKQDITTHRHEVTASLGLSVAAGPSSAGARIGGSVSMGTHYAPDTRLTQRDDGGAYQVSVERRGWYARTRVAGGASANAYFGPGGLPPVPIARGTMTRDERGGAVRVRIPTRDGNIVPEKTFSDTDTASPDFMKQIVLAKREAWVQLFAHPHRHEPDGGRAVGEQALAEFFHTITAVRAGNQRYYARERLHPDVGQRLDELASLVALTPAPLAPVRDEIVRQQQALLSDDRSWRPASLIAYERHSVEQGAAGGIGVEGRRVMAAEGEREFVFHTPGWADLRAQERSDAGRPQSLDELDQASTNRPDPPASDREAMTHPRPARPHDASASDQVTTAHPQRARRPDAPASDQVTTAQPQRARRPDPPTSA